MLELQNKCWVQEHKLLILDCYVFFIVCTDKGQSFDNSPKPDKQWKVEFGFKPTNLQHEHWVYKHLSHLSPLLEESTKNTDTGLLHCSRPGSAGYRCCQQQKGILHRSPFIYCNSWRMDQDSDFPGSPEQEAQI